MYNCNCLILRVAPLVVGVSSTVLSDLRAAASRKNRRAIRIPRSLALSLTLSFVRPRPIEILPRGSPGARAQTEAVQVYKVRI